MNKLEHLIPNEMLEELARAIDNDYFSMVLIVSYEAMASLKRNKPALLKVQTEDGEGVIILLAERALEGVYQNEPK